jgi:hypothetical protein
MAKRFTRQWYEECGETINDEWMQLIDRFTPAQIDAAFDAMHKREWFGMPKHPQIASLLEAAAAKNPDDAADYVRGYWRAAVMAEIERTGALVNAWKFGTRIHDIELPTRHFVMREGHSLIDRLVEMERANGRTPEQFRVLSEQVWRVVATLVPMPQPRAKRQTS